MSKHRGVIVKQNEAMSVPVTYELNRFHVVTAAAGRAGESGGVHVSTIINVAFDKKAAV
jgi:hypothetical protein